MAGLRGRFLPIASSRCLAAAAWVLLSFAAGAAPQPDVERQMLAGLVPPVVVKGESPTLTPLAARMQDLHVPGVGIAVIHGGQIVWAGGFGSMRAGGSAVTADTLFQAASISKALTATAVMSLVQIGKLDLDVDVNQFLKSWKLPPSPFTEHQPVTLRELLSHSAGINLSGVPGYEAGQPVPTLVQVLDGRPPAKNAPIRIDSEPGTTWRYSGGGYTIIQQVLIDTTGQAFPELMRERVLVPFGMKQSSFQQPPTADILLRAATPYAANGDAVTGGPMIYPTMAPAGLWTTPSDLARYAIEIQRALGGMSSKVLSQASAHAMLSEVRSASGLPLRTTFPTGVKPGMGHIIGVRTNQKYFVHPGANSGYACYLLAYDSGDGVVIMTNSDNGQSLISEILRTIAYDSKWPDYLPPERTLAVVDPAQFDQFVGAYQSATGELAVFWREDRHLESRVWGLPRAEIFASSAGEYFQKTADVIWMFGDGGIGAAIHVRRSESGREQQLDKLNDQEGRALLEQSVKTEARVKEQTPAVGGEQALVKTIAEVARGNPNYDQMAPQFAATVRQELHGMHSFLSERGPVQSVAFKRVLAGGKDVYSVTFQHGSLDMEVLLAPDGRIYSLGYE